MSRLTLVRLLLFVILRIHGFTSYTMLTFPSLPSSDVRTHSFLPFSPRQYDHHQDTSLPSFAPPDNAHIVHPPSLYDREADEQIDELWSSDSSQDSIEYTPPEQRGRRRGAA